MANSIQRFQNRDVPMGKAIIWIVTLVGLVPAILVAVMGVAVLVTARWASPLRTKIDSPSSSATVFVHDAYFMFWSWRIDFNPQCWSVGILLLGIAMILIALSMILCNSGA